MARRCLVRFIQVKACWDCQVWVRSDRKIYKLSFETSRKSLGWKFTSQLIVISTGRRRVHDYRSTASPRFFFEVKMEDNVRLLSQLDTLGRISSRNSCRDEKTSNGQIPLVESRANVCRKGACRSNGRSISMANFRIIWALEAIGTRTSNRLTADRSSKERTIFPDTLTRYRSVSKKLFESRC